MGKLSWQVFDAEIITVHKDKASPVSLGREQGCLSSQVSGIQFELCTEYDYLQEEDLLSSPRGPPWTRRLLKGLSVPRPGAWSSPLSLKELWEVRKGSKPSGPHRQPSLGFRPFS